MAGYARLFDSSAFFFPIALAAVLGHVVAAVLRRVGIGPLLSTMSHLCLLPLVLTAMRYRSTSNRLLPTSRTVDALADDLAEFFAD